MTTGGGMRRRASGLFVAVSLGCLALFGIASLAHGNPPSIVVSERCEADKAVYQALAKRREWVFRETPLRELSGVLQQELGVNVVLNEQALVSAQGDLDAPVSLELHDVSARSVLGLLARSHEVGWLVRDGYLVLTSLEIANETRERHVYDLSGLSPPFDAEGNELPFDSEALIELITQSIAPESWDELSGQGSLHEFQSEGARGLIVSQTREQHEAIEALFTRLLALKQHYEQPQAPPPAPPPSAALGERDARVHAALDVRRDWEFPGLTLSGVAATLEAAIGFDVVLDPAASDALWGDAASPFSLSMRDASARLVLDLLLPRDRLTWTVRDEVLVITRADDVLPQMAVRVYDVGDLYPARDAAG
jgi:hypothetical protein